ncbi:MAG: BspA family leucine-rich repeat surface protein, partial [Sulfurovaceae bacterium]|nr:BspA family leucine-rich repeat surface protein [Sulfurovaceae bacterium]
DDDETSSESSYNTVPVQKTQKHVSDGYLIKLPSPATANCNNHSYNSSLTIGVKGLITFEGVTLDNNCIITIPSGATIDSNNNGVLDDTDKVLNFEMKAPADASFISPFTTLLLKLKEQIGRYITEDDYNSFKSTVKDFDPVKGASAITTATGIEKLKLQKLMILAEALKTALNPNSNAGDIERIDVSNIIDTNVSDTITNFHLIEGSCPLNSLCHNIIVSPAPAPVLSHVVRDKESIMRDIVAILDSLDPAKIDLDVFLVNISDGMKNIEEAINASKKTPISGNIFEFPIKTTADVPSVAYTLRSINDNINNLGKLVANAGTDQNVTYSTMVTLDGSASHPSESIVSYKWREGNITLSSSSTFTKNDFSVGEHNITLTISDSNDINYTDNLIVNIRAIAPNDYFITTWKTDNNGSSGDNQISIPTYSGEDYNYFIDWGDGETNSSVIGDINHTYATAGTYTVKIYGDFPQIYFHDNFDTPIISDAKKLLSIEQWGTIKWQSMYMAFQGCSNMIMNASDIPNLSQVDSLSGMFSEASSFNQYIADWNVSTINSMDYMFSGATSFNQDISNWDVSNVINMDTMFQHATSFN